MRIKDIGKLQVKYIQMRSYKYGSVNFLPLLRTHIQRNGRIVLKALSECPFHYPTSVVWDKMTYVGLHTYSIFGVIKVILRKSKSSVRI